MSRPNPHPRLLRDAAVRRFLTLASHPARALTLAAIAIGLAWLIVTKSLSYAVAERSPDLALWLDPRQPLALLERAERARTKLLKATSLDMDVTASTSGPAESTARSQGSGTAGALQDKRSAAEEREALREEIGSLADRVVSGERLEARAFRLLAEATSDLSKARLLMQRAVQLSRHESHAVFWLMNDSFERKDLSEVLEKADILLRTRQDLHPHVMGYLGDIAATPEGRKQLIPLLARKNPPWRAAFFNSLPSNVVRMETPLDVLLALKDAGSPPSSTELTPYIKFLVSKKRLDIAYGAWLQFVPQQQLESIGFLNNPAFAQDPSGIPFDWSFQRGQNTIIDFIPLRDAAGSRALRFRFGTGRVRFPEASQVLLLAPGRYRLSGAAQGRLTARRGLRWEIRCLGGGNALAETDMIFGSLNDQQAFTLDVRIPDGENCRAQRLRLYHHARSPSEELMSGEIFFRRLKLVRLEPVG